MQIRLHNDSFLGISSPQDVRSVRFEMEFQFQFHGCQDIARHDMPPLVQSLFLRVCSKYSGSWVRPRQCEFSASGMKSPKPSSMSGMLVIPICTWCQNDATSKLSYVDKFGTVTQNSKDSLAICLQTHVLTLKSPPKSLPPVNSRSSKKLDSRTLLLL